MAKDKNSQKIIINTESGAEPRRLLDIYLYQTQSFRKPPIVQFILLKRVIFWACIFLYVIIFWLPDTYKIIGSILALMFILGLYKKCIYTYTIKITKAAGVSVYSWLADITRYYYQNRRRYMFQKEAKCAEIILFDEIERFDKKTRKKRKNERRSQLKSYEEMKAIREGRPWPPPGTKTKQEGATSAKPGAKKEKVGWFTSGKKKQKPAPVTKDGTEANVNASEDIVQQSAVVSKQPTQNSVPKASVSFFDVLLGRHKKKSKLKTKESAIASTGTTDDSDINDAAISDGVNELAPQPAVAEVKRITKSTNEKAGISFFDVLLGRHKKKGKIKNGAQEDTSVPQGDEYE